MRFWVTLHFAAYGGLAIGVHSTCAPGGDSVEGMFFAALAASALLWLIVDVIVICKAKSNIERFVTCNQHWLQPFARCPSAAFRRR